MKLSIFILMVLSINLLYANRSPLFATPLNQLFSAAQQGDPKAAYQLATQYRDGEGLPIDFLKAFNLYHQAALKNFPPAQYQLGMMFRHGLGVKTNHDLARYWLRKAAKNNHPQAQDIFRAFYTKKARIPQYQFTRN